MLARPSLYVAGAFLGLSAFGLLEPCADPRLAQGAAGAALYLRLHESFHAVVGIKADGTTRAASRCGR